MENSREERWRRTVLALLANRQWDLVVDLDGFVRKICTELKERRVEEPEKEKEIVERLVKREYSAILHAACCGSDHARQNQAFSELWRYLYSVALHKTHSPDLAQEIAQRSLSKVFAKRSECREPQRFLKWVLQILARTRIDYFRESRKEIDISGLTEDNMPEIWLDRISADSGERDIEQALDREYIQEFIAVVQTCVKRVLEQLVLVGELALGLECQEIAHDLGIQVNHVYQLRHTGMPQLRQCPRFLEFVSRKGGD